MDNRDKLAVIILAAGRGKRMKSPLQKVLHRVAGKTMVRRVVETARTLEPEKILVIVGHQAENVRRELAGCGVCFVEQGAPLGTGHAVAQTAGLLRDYRHDILVMCGDTPLMRPETLAGLRAAHHESGAAATVMTTELHCPAGYGRIRRNGAGEVESIIEESDAGPEEKMIREINSGVYLFHAPKLFDNLQRVRPDNAKGEYYLTDIIRILRSRGEPVAAFRAAQPNEVLGINTPGELAHAAEILKTGPGHG